MGADLYWYGKDIQARSFPRLQALLRRIKKDMENDGVAGDYWKSTIAEIEQELYNSDIH